MRRFARIARYTLWAGVVCGTLVPAAAQEPLPISADIEFFETRVRPVLAANCYGCHGPEKQFNSLRLGLSRGDDARRRTRPRHRLGQA